MGEIKKLIEGQSSEIRQLREPAPFPKVSVEKGEDLRTQGFTRLGRVIPLAARSETFAILGAPPSRPLFCGRDACVPQKSNGRLTAARSIIVELGFATIPFSLPQLLLALLGGWLSRRLELADRFALANSATQRAANPRLRSQTDLEIGLTPRADPET